MFRRWDVMSLLKACNGGSAAVGVTWFPAGHSIATRFVNEIRAGEEEGKR